MKLTNIVQASRKIPDAFHNMPKRFVDRHLTFIEKRMPRLPQYEQKIFRYKRKAYYDIWRPWEDEFKRLNSLTAKVTQPVVEPIKDFPYFRGDRVEILRGPDKGKQGIINYIVKERNWVVVRGLNVSRKYMNKERLQVGNIVVTEEPLLINHEVKLVDPTDLQPTDVEWRYDEEGNKVRISTRTERAIPIPRSAYETMDYTLASEYREREKDTPAKLVNKVTFQPAPKTFEMDICEQMGIKDDRVPYPMYWY